ncbi:hypothetical protein CC86DRAFT_76892 [Ophiobolus disseminans]|uniref:Uncharacterized protein n=1 Tax=Ophiobolus disseminans TaxID=1469910 RepID=A0A6A6ZRT3_9PLEO|nr:hypothetical protein CC86DRAFT_76892 [Ophiobolus disseminans]
MRRRYGQYLSECVSNLRDVRDSGEFAGATSKRRRGEHDSEEGTLHWKIGPLAEEIVCSAHYCVQLARFSDDAIETSVRYDNSTRPTAQCRNREPTNGYSRSFSNISIRLITSEDVYGRSSFGQCTVINGSLATQPWYRVGFRRNDQASTRSISTLGLISLTRICNTPEYR